MPQESIGAVIDVYSGNAPELEVQADPFILSQVQERACDHAQRTAMGHQSYGLLPRSAKLLQGGNNACMHFSDSFTAWRAEVHWIGCPCFHLGSRNARKIPHLPFAEVDLAQAGIDARCFVQPFGESPAACRWAGEHPKPCWKHGTQSLHAAERIISQFDVARSIAEASRNDRARVANQIEFDSSPGSSNNQTKLRAR